MVDIVRFHLRQGLEWGNQDHWNSCFTGSDRVAQMKAEATRLEITAGVTSFGRYPRPLDHMPASAGAGRLFSIR